MYHDPQLPSIAEGPEDAPGYVTVTWIGQPRYPGAMTHRQTGGQRLMSPSPCTDTPILHDLVCCMSRFAAWLAAWHAFRHCFEAGDLIEVVFINEVGRLGFKMPRTSCQKMLPKQIHKGEIGVILFKHVDLDMV